MQINSWELLRYVKYIKDGKVKIQCFLSGIPWSYKYIIEFNEPQTLNETIKKAKYCYDQNKSRIEFHKASKEKQNEKLYQRKRGFKPPHFRYQQRLPTRGVTNPTR